MDRVGTERKFELLLRRIGDLPSLPDLVNKILEMLNRPNVPASKIATLISYDPGLTSKFLRIVNSAAYGFQRQISSVQHAVMILGFGMVRGVVLSASIFKLFEGKHNHGLDPTDFWQHSIGTAIGSRILAEKWKIRYAEDAFSAGMLHDIGKMILNCYIFNEYQEVLNLADKQGLSPHGRDFLEIEQNVLGFNHADLGYHLATKWKLPATFSEVIRCHHHPEVASNASELVYVIAMSNAFSELTGTNYGVFNPERIPRVVLEHFGYDEEKNHASFTELFDQVSGEMNGVEELLISLKQ